MTKNSLLFVHYTKMFENVLENKELIYLFSERYNLQIADIKSWLSITKWSRKKSISKNKINNIQQKLKQFGVINNVIDADKLLANILE